MSQVVRGDMSQRLFLITGANGFIGSEIARLLASRNIRIRALVRHPDRGRELQNLGAELAVGDLRDRDSLRRAVAGVYGVYHIAALYRETRFGEPVFHDVNAEGTRRLFEESIAGGVRRIVHCSTGGVLGDIKNPPGNEDSPYAPSDMYQRSKVEAEKIALSYFSSGRIGGVVVRPGMVYGPRDIRFLKMFQLIARRRFFFVGRGVQWVHFVDVRDLAQGFWLAMEHEERNGAVYTISGAQAMPFCNMVNLIADALGVARPRFHIPLRPMQLLAGLCEAVCVPVGIRPPLFRRRVDFFCHNRYFDIGKARRELGYQPQRSAKEEVADIVAWYREHEYL